MREIPVLETERLILREIRETDIDDVREIFSHREMFLFTNSDVDLSGDPVSFKDSQVLNWISSWRNDRDLLCWGIELKQMKKLIGRIYLYGFCGNDTAGYRVDIGYSLSKKYWGNGYAAEAVRQVVDCGFSSLKIIRFQAEIIPENIASIRVCEKAGFQQEGLLRRYALYDHNGNCFKDIVMMALTH